MKKYNKPMAQLMSATGSAILTGSNIANYKGEYNGSLPLKSKEGATQYSFDL